MTTSFSLALTAVDVCMHNGLDSESAQAELRWRTQGLFTFTDKANEESGQHIMVSCLGNPFAVRW